MIRLDFYGNHKIKVAIPGVKEYETFLRKFVNFTLAIIKGKPISCTGNSRSLTSQFTFTLKLINITAINKK